MIAVTSPGPQSGWIITWPVRYVRAMSYGSLWTDFEREPVSLAPLENELLVPHFGHVTREIIHAW